MLQEALERSTVQVHHSSARQTDHAHFRGNRPPYDDRSEALIDGAIPMRTIVASTVPTGSVTSGADLDGMDDLRKHQKHTTIRFTFCWVLILLAAVFICGSLTVGLYYSIARDRMADGFTAASWITAVGTLALAFPAAKHYPHCKCWKKDSDAEREEHAVRQGTV